MNWVSALCDLYDKNQDLAGVYEERKKKDGSEAAPLILLPVSHITVTAQITVTLDENGNFLGAKTVPEEDKLTVIPVTEASGSRTAGKAPHPYCDNLKYLAGDFIAYYRNDKKKDLSEYYQLYIEALKNWAEFPYSHEKVKALYRYLSKKSLIRDLVNAEILKVDEDGYLVEAEKIQKVSQVDAFVRFRVERRLPEGVNLLEDEKGSFISECWLDRSLQNTYIEYYEAQSPQKDLCYLSGEIEQTASFHPKKIRNEGDGAKLISANDETNFTYRGRFEKKEEAFSIGYETSQKAHNALKWIIRKQGYLRDGLCIVIWESNLLSMPDVFCDTDQISDTAQEEDLWGDEETEEIYDHNTGEVQASRFRAALAGYGRRIDDTSRMFVLSLDAATTGRLALTGFQELESSRYLANMAYWFETCCWHQIKFKEKKFYHYLGMPGAGDIAEILYGSEQNGFLSLSNKPKLYAEVCKRLLPCIINRKPIPKDWIDAAILKASSPLSFGSVWNWQKTLSLACSFVKKQRYEETKEEWSVSLDKKNQDRNYLYGRLLALAEQVESLTFDKDDNRETNAMRLMSAFSRRPYQTWMILEEKLEPYFRQLKPEVRFSKKRDMNEVFELFQKGDFEKDEKLNGLYLLGYHNQAYQWMNHEKKNNAEKEEEEK